MVLDTPTWIALALLVLAASLASYLLGAWPLLRPGRSMGRAGVAVGTALLLTAATIALLTTNLLPGFFVANDEPTGLADSRAQRLAPDGAPRQRHADPSIDHDMPQDPAHEAEAGHDERTRAIEPLSAQPLSRSAPAGSSALARAPSRTSTSTANPATPAAVNPWSATACVLAIQPDPADPSRWLFDNACGSPVGILFSACEPPAERCILPRSTTWRYSPKAMVLPAKSARPVTYAEQTQRGHLIRYVACIVTAPQAVAHIHRDTFAHASDADREDVCLSNVRHAARTGAQSGLPIEALLGGIAPGRILRAD